LLALPLAAFFVVSAVPVARADFVGELVLLPAGCEITGRCELGEDLGFIDPGGAGWQASKGLITDGASIPAWARPMVGEPFDRNFINAAIIGDIVVCVPKVLP
jgi:hypothetical protein